MKAGGLLENATEPALYKICKEPFGIASVQTLEKKPLKLKRTYLKLAHV